MARLQKKKNVAERKKKKPQANGSTSPQSGEAAVAQKGPLFGGGPKGRKPQAMQKNGSAGSRSTPARLEPNIFEKGVQFLREVKIELKKVAWPSRKQTIGSTAVVIILVMIIAFFLGVVDLGLSSLVRVIIQ